MAFTLQTLLPPTRSGRTFFVASALLGIGAGVQLILMGVFLLRAGRSAQHPTGPGISFAETLQPAMPALEAPTPAPQIARPHARAHRFTRGGPGAGRRRADPADPSRR